MQSRTNFLVLICLTFFVSISFAQQDAVSPEQTPPAGEPNQFEPLSFPYVAEITTDNVNIRSGPGTNYYRCGKLNKNDRVKVVASQFSWSRIVPPAGCFSWISKQYVQPDPDNPDVGTLTGDAVRVYAGSEFVKPIHSTTVQLKLNKNDKVKLLGAEQGDYYKIAPPDGSYLWVSTEYTKPLGPVEEVPLAADLPEQTQPATPELALTDFTPDTAKLAEYYTIEKQIKTERAKPVEQQDYSAIKKALTELANDQTAGKAARYAKFTIKQVEGCELALAVAEQIQRHDAYLQSSRDRIEKARASKLAQIQDLGKFATVGTFKLSNIYSLEQDTRHYRVVDDSGKTVCYAIPTSAAEKLDLSKFIEQKVGLIGTSEPHRQTSNALVRFTEIVKLK